MSGPRPRLVAATSNEHKLRELRRLLPDVELTGVDELARAGALPWPVEETGETFVENAMLKALHVSRHVSLPVVADDSGLCVDHLGGAPGVRSARHGGLGLTDAQRYELLLSQLEGVPDHLRSAHYRAALAVARGGRLLSVHEGTCAGRILQAPRGEGGFGYDPIFLVEALARSMAEITPEEKDASSHRARAAAGLRAAIADGLLND